MRLQELIKARRAELGLTWDQLIERTGAAGHPIGRSMFLHLTRDDWPNPPTTNAILGIAAAIELPTDAVWAAIAESLGWRTEVVMDDPNVRAMLAMFADRTDDERSALVQVVRSVVRVLNAGAAAAAVLGAAADAVDGAAEAGTAVDDPP